MNFSENGHEPTLNIQSLKLDDLTSNHTNFFLFVQVNNGLISASYQRLYFQYTDAVELSLYIFSQSFKINVQLYQFSLLIFL
jgi:hypothetical protein